jgi:hypothetical protein
VSLSLDRQEARSKTVFDVFSSTAPTVGDSVDVGIPAEHVTCFRRV